MPVTDSHSNSSDLPVADIVVPVWNRPVETRACLVNLCKYSPRARLLLVNNGSDRETERLLEEFAEVLDERALLITLPANLGFIKAVNRGLASAEAEFAAVVRNTTLVSEGWLDPLLALAETVPEAGTIVPLLVRGNGPKPGTSRTRTTFATELSQGDFAAMAIRKSLLDGTGGFDEEMDEKWCLWDFARRSLAAGYFTYAAERSPVICRDDPPLGSAVRREEIVRRSMATCAARWGSPISYCVYFPPDADVDTIQTQFAIMLRGARQGHGFTVAVLPSACRELKKRGCDLLHRNIVLEKLPRFFPDGGVKKIVTALRSEKGDVVLVAGAEGVAFPGGEASIHFSDLARSIEAASLERYGERRESGHGVGVEPARGGIHEDSNCIYFR